MRIPFDSLCLAGVIAEIRPLLGARMQGARQTDPHTLVLTLYGSVDSADAQKAEHWLLLSADPELARMHLASRKPPRMEEIPAFADAVRRRLDGARLAAIEQRGCDRIVDFAFSAAEGEYRLVAELMGKHSNLMLLDPERRVVAALKWVGPSKSRRPILPNHAYEPPPFEPRAPVLKARQGDDLLEYEGASPFFARLAEAVGLELLQRAWREQDFSPVYVDGHGSYPVSVSALGLKEVPRESLSQALEQHFAALAATKGLEQVRGSLLGQLRRVALAREVALADLRQAADTATRAGVIQERAQIILAYAASATPGAKSLEAYDFEGKAVTIPLDPDLTPLENANRLFDKAKRAKNAAPTVAAQLQRLGDDLAALEAAIRRAEDAQSVAEIEDVRSEADRHRWLHHQPSPSRTKEERPYQGHAIRELLAPGGWKVLYGESATANDYLTLRVGRPNDWWLHVRGGVSAHVIIQTQNQPERVPKEALLFAAKVAVRNSPSKHSGYVPVDYCLKKYVRRPKGAPPGTVTYSHEKTLHVERD
ncbi:MAG TPA: NFACT family protein [Fimbriimonadaceae bacterium]|nr:NFACT family protein [Fimbriimonadaceae bacterium]HRJ97015.1 NFACT family protein [Fimbriimonadaceae bacterium]